jgi:hypothetical protein
MDYVYFFPPEVYLGSIWYKVLQYPQPLVDPLSSFLHTANNSISNGGFSLNLSFFNGESEDHQ